MTDSIPSRRSAWRDAVVLAIFSGLIYTVGLTNQGLMNWQESQRALVGREMFERGEWVVPTVFGVPYLAKPPMIYWAQLVIGRARGGLGFAPFADETELRLTVALGGIAGVLATYFASRRLLRDAVAPRAGDDAAWWTALGLSCGVLYVRSSRIGELDVLTVPFVVTAVTLVIHAWRSAEEDGRTRYRAVGLAALASTGAAMTKGPPALLTIALGAYGSIILLARPRPPAAAEAESSARSGFAANVSGLAAACAVIGVTIARPQRWNSVSTWVGAAVFGAMAFALARGSARAFRSARSRAWLFALSRTHPLIVLGAPVAVFWLWTRAVAARIGDDQVAVLTGRELEENIRVLVTEAVTKNLGFMLYGVGPISLAALAAIIWVVRQRPQLTSEQRVPLAWLGLGFAAFSMLGKGVARYLTPLWPAVAMAGGVWLARRTPPRLRAGVTILFIACGLAQGWWYGYGRTEYARERSPRGFFRELMPLIEPDHLGVWMMHEPGLDYYAGQQVERWGDPTGGGAAELAAHIEGSGKAYVLLGVDAERKRRLSVSVALAECRARGMRIEPLALRSRCSIEDDEPPLGAWRIESRTAAPR